MKGSKNDKENVVLINKTRKYKVNFYLVWVNNNFQYLFLNLGNNIKLLI